MHDLCTKSLLLLRYHSYTTLKHGTKSTLLLHLHYCQILHYFSIQHLYYARQVFVGGNHPIHFLHIYADKLFSALPSSTLFVLVTEFTAHLLGMLLALHSPHIFPKSQVENQPYSDISQKAAAGNLTDKDTSHNCTRLKIWKVLVRVVSVLPEGTWSYPTTDVSLSAPLPIQNSSQLYVFIAVPRKSL